MKISLDLHGVVDKEPNKFSDITHMFPYEFFIITGEELSKKLYDEIRSYNLKIEQKNIYSITSFHKQLGTPIKYLNNNPYHPYINEEIWNRTKAVMCNLLDINYHIDDSEIYGKYFTQENGCKTSYIYFYKDRFKYYIEFLRSIL